MSLYRQLWIGIAITMLLVFGATFTINSISSSSYLEQQLSIKNSDEANAIALSLSQQSLDPVALEIQLASLLDQGSYESVEFESAEGELVFSRQQRFEGTGTPDWFQMLFPIESSEGRADVSNGWAFLGTLSLKSHDAFAYRELWASGQRTLVALVIAVLIAGTVASLILRVILRPLDRVVEQAQAIGERRFLLNQEPRTRELAQLTRSMNALAERVREMLSRESSRLGEELQSTSTDPQTGLLNLATFTDRLAASIQADDADAQGVVAITRIDGLMKLNQEFGRPVIDTVLRETGDLLRNWGDSDKTLFLGRSAGSEFCVLAPRQTDAQELAKNLREQVRTAFKRHELGSGILLPTVCSIYAAGDSPATLLDELNASLVAAVAKQSDDIHIAAKSDRQDLAAHARMDHWRRLLVAALTEQQLWLAVYPIMGSNGELLHDAGMLRISNDNGTLNAGEFLPWVHRLGLDDELDRAVLALGLEKIADSGRPLCVNLTVASLRDERIIPWLSGQLSTHQDAARMLSANISESLAFSNPQGFRRLHQALRAYGAQLGIARMGYRVADIGMLSELGPDHLKIDGLFVRGIADNEGNKALMRTYAGIASSLGIPCIAEGVDSGEDHSAALTCGATGATGPAVGSS